MTHLKQIILLSLILLLNSCISHKASHLEQAKIAKDNGKHELAISFYQKHLDSRLKISNRPKWENPYVYLLDIGDIYLQMDLPQKALENYLTAQKNKVRKELIADRIRLLAKYYQNNGDTQEAIRLLTEYNDLDPDLHNLILDKIAKKIVKESGNLTD